jgi:hypothetical protein
MMVQKGIVVRRERLAGRVAAAAILTAALFTAMTATLWTAAVCAEEPARGPAAFQPGDISIGDPVALPFAKPVAPSHAPHAAGGRVALRSSGHSPGTRGGSAGVTGPQWVARHGRGRVDRAGQMVDR